MIPFLLTPGHDIQPTVLELPDQARSFSKPVLSFTSQMLLFYGGDKCRASYFPEVGALSKLGQVL